MKSPSPKFQVIETFLPVWSTAFRILPFKVRSLYVFPCPCASLIPLSPKGSLGAPRVSFFNKLSPASHAITSVENFHAGFFPAALKINSSWWPFVLCFVCRSFYTLSLHSWIAAGPVNGTTRRERLKKKEEELWMSADHILMVLWPLSCSQELHCASTWNTLRRVCEIHLVSIWLHGEQSNITAYTSALFHGIVNHLSTGCPHNPSQC